MDFLSDIPIWAYLLIAGLGAVLGGVLIFMHVRAARQPGTRAKGATPQLILGILSLVLLVIVPLVLMIIASSQDDGRDRRRGRSRDASAVSRSGDDPGNMSWRVRFVVDGVTYRGQFEPRDGSGPLKIAYTSGGVPTQVREECTLTGETRVRITCRDPRILSGIDTYVPDNFELRWDGEDEMTGSITAATDAGTVSGTATFTRGTDPEFAGASWDAPGTAPVTPQQGGAGADAGNLAARLAAAVEQQRSRLPLRSGPTTITAIEAIGKTVNFYVTISQDLSPTDWAELEQVMRSQACSGPLGPLIRSGATISFQMLDSGEEQRALSVSSC